MASLQPYIQSILVFVICLSALIMAIRWVAKRVDENFSVLDDSWLFENNEQDAAVDVFGPERDWSAEALRLYDQSVWLQDQRNALLRKACKLFDVDPDVDSRERSYVEQCFMSPYGEYTVHDLRDDIDRLRASQSSSIHLNHS